MISGCCNLLQPVCKSLILLLLQPLGALLQPLCKSLKTKDSQGAATPLYINIYPGANAPWIIYLLSTRAA